MIAAAAKPQADSIAQHLRGLCPPPPKAAN